MMILITGGAGFIGSALIRYLIENTQEAIVNVDKLTYAGNLSALESVAQSHRYHFEHMDICESEEMNRIFKTYQPDAVMHLAAESHVDRSINNSTDFIQTNIVGTHVLLEAARVYWQNLPDEKKATFRFHHISTDEVYGDLEDNYSFFTETSSYAPSSPYSASKASSDHLVRAWHRTYGLPILVTNCSNNYGPYQYPEKLIPLTILNAINGRALPVYGSGLQIRDWLYVDDHARALYTVLVKGQVGETYAIGGHNERTNLEVIHMICSLLDELVPLKSKEISHYRNLITHVQDRSGHDLRYAINATKMKQSLGWVPDESFESGLRKTVEWYLMNMNKLSFITNTQSIPYESASLEQAVS